MTNPLRFSVISGAFIALVDTVISTGPNPMIYPASVVLSDFITPGARDVPQISQSLHSLTISILPNSPPFTTIKI